MNATSDDDRPPKRLRKGTRSCVACRKRRVKCVFASQQERVCKNCADRGTACMEQGITDVAINESTRERMERLESMVISLAAKVNTLESVKDQTDTTTTSVSFRDEISETADEAEYSQDEGNDVNVLNAGNYHFRDLFDNYIISSAPVQYDTSRPQNASRKTATQIVKAKLLSLVPPHEDVVAITKAAPNWWAINNKMVSNMKLCSLDEFISSRERLWDEETLFTTIGHWLICMAITIFQLPSTFDFSATQSLKHPQDSQKHAMAEVERCIIADDAAMGTVGGLECAARFVQLEMFYGHAKKGWILLRRALALAEMIGLPSSHKQLKALSQQNSNPETVRQLEIRSDFWEALCHLDRSYSMLLGLQSATSHLAPPSLPRTQEQLAVDEGTFMRAISDIASSVLRRDQIEDEEAAIVETNRLLSELKYLEHSRAPSWWQLHTSTDLDITAVPPLLSAFFHRYLVMRTHLPYLLKAKSDHQYMHHAVSCLQASEDVLQRWVAARQMFDDKVLMSKAIDMQAFTTSILLTLYRDRNGHYQDNTTRQAQFTADLGLLNQFKAVLLNTPTKTAGGMTSHMIYNLEQLEKCLAGEVSSSRITLQVPLLGAITVSRRRHESSTRGPPSGYTDQSSSVESLQGYTIPASPAELQTGSFPMHPDYNMSSAFNLPIEFNIDDIDIEWVGQSMFNPWD